VHRIRWLPIASLLLGAALAFHPPTRDRALAAVRFPFTATVHALKIIAALPRLPGLRRENLALRAQLAEQGAEVATLRELMRQATQAQALAEALPAMHGTVAVVIGRSPVPSQHAVLVDKGARHGLTLESAVIDASGVVGRVAEAGPETAMVMLITDSDSRIAGLIERSRETGLLVGSGGGSCDLVYLDTEADIQEGDRVLTAGLGGIFPKGLLLGTVERVIRDDASGTTTARVTPAVRLGQLEEVLCLPRPVAP